MYRFFDFVRQLKHRAPENNGRRGTPGIRAQWTRPKHFEHLSFSSEDRVWIQQEAHLQNKVYQKSKRVGFCNWRESWNKNINCFRLSQRRLPLSAHFKRKVKSQEHLDQGFWDQPAKHWVCQPNRIKLIDIFKSRFDSEESVWVL